MKNYRKMQRNVSNMNIEKRIDAWTELNRYAELCNDEYGELLFHLGELLRKFEMITYDNTKSAIEHEVKWHLCNLHHNARIVEDEVVENGFRSERLEWKADE